MALLFNPTSLEWLALIALLAVSILSSSLFSSLALGVQWRIIWKKMTAKMRSKGNRYFPVGIIPRMFNPYVYGTLRFLMNALIAFSYWWVWRQAYRSEFTPLYAAAPSGVVDVNYFFISTLFYLIFAASIVTGPLIHFNFGITHGWVWISILAEFVTFAVSVFCTIYFWLIIPLSGILSLIVSVFYLYSVYAWWCFSKNSVYQGLLTDPVDCLYENIYPREHLLEHNYGVVIQHVQYEEQGYGQGYGQDYAPQGYGQPVYQPQVVVEQYTQNRVGRY